MERKNIFNAKKHSIKYFSYMKNEKKAQIKMYNKTQNRMRSAASKFGSILY